MAFAFHPVQAHLLLSIHQTLHLCSFLLWLYLTLRAGPSLNCRFGQLLLGHGWRFMEIRFLLRRWSSYSECIPSCCGGFHQQNYIPFLRRRGLAMGSSYAILLLFFSFEGAQSYYHVQLFQTKNLNQKCECSKYHWKFCLASQNSQFCGVRGILAATQVHHCRFLDHSTDLARLGKLPCTRWMTSQS